MGRLARCFVVGGLACCCLVLPVACLGLMFGYPGGDARYFYLAVMLMAGGIAFAWTAVRDRDSRTLRGSCIVVALGIPILALSLGCWVPQGAYGLLHNVRSQERTRSPGWHIKCPFSRVTLVSTGSEVQFFSFGCSTKDRIGVTVHLGVEYHIDPDGLSALHTKLLGDVSPQKIRLLVEEIVKENLTTSVFGHRESDLLAQRVPMELELTQSTAGALREAGVVLLHAGIAYFSK